MSSVSYIRRITQNRLFQHSLFWVLSFYLLARLFAYEVQLTTVDWVYTFLFHFSLWLAVYMNLLWLIPRYLEPKKYLVFSTFLIAVVLASIGLNLLTFNYLSDFLFPDYYFIAYYDFWDIFEFIAAYIIITSLIKLSKSWFKVQETQQELIRLEREKLDAELSALKSQVNPHFLFNSLNNLYSLALDGDARTPGIILRLSEMMRYLLYDTNTPMVPLAMEILYLQNYIEMQRLRVGEKVSLDFKIEGEMNNLQIAPLLFLTLVENGFKHGIKAETEDAFIAILLSLADHSLVFKVENNKGMVDEVETEKKKGIGLKNLRRRLELQYPGRHQLEVTESKKTFTVVLNLTLSEKNHQQ